MLAKIQKGGSAKILNNNKV